MAPVLGLIIGVLTGALIAKRKGGKMLDILQYAAGFGIIFTIIGLFFAIFLARNAS